MSEILLELDPAMSLADTSKDIGNYIMLPAGQYILSFDFSAHSAPFEQGEFDFLTDSYGPLLMDAKGILVL